MEHDFYTIPEAAEHCSVSRTTMWRWVKSGKVKAFTTLGGRHRILKEDLQILLCEMHAFSLPESGRVGRAKSSLKTSGRILVVDDEPVVREMLREIFELRGFQTDTAVDGFDAGVKLAQFAPDLVSLDLFMPGMNGFEVCKRIKENPLTSRIKVLAVTGFDTKENRVRIMAAGADGYLTKPVDTGKLLQEVNMLLSKQASPSAESAG